MQNPRDAVSWNRLLLLIEGVGPKKSQAIITALSAAMSKETDWLKALKAQSMQSSGGVLKEVTRLFEDLRDAAQVPSEQLNRVYTYYIPLLSQRFDDHPKRIKDLEYLYAITERYLNIDAFLSDITLEPPSELVSEFESTKQPIGQDDERLILSTIHSAKGLEWHTVFIIWALDGKFPSMYSFDNKEELEEERRLMYVATTRAKKGLYISYPINVYEKIQGTILSRPSRFLDGIPRSYYETWSILE
jgi:DNA helicase-2/ATP-dependent DNA helicase PcrA